MGEQVAKRQEIAEAAWTVISERGIDGASMRAIARKAGYTTGAIVHYFENKDELLEYVIHHQSERFAESLVELQAQGDVVASIRELTINSIPIDSENLKRSSGWQSFLTTAENNPRIASTIRNIIASNIEKLTALVKRGQGQGVIRNDLEASELADQLNAFTEGIVRIAPIEYDRLTAERLRRLVEVQIEMMRP